MSGIISRVNNDIIETYQGQDAQGDVGDTSFMSALADITNLLPLPTGADDTVNIQNLLNNISNKSLTISHNYIVGTPSSVSGTNTILYIVGQSNFKIKGNNGSIKLKNGAGNKIVLAIVDCTDFEIDGLMIDGNVSNQTIIESGVSGRLYSENCPDILLENAKRFKVRNCTLKNAQGDGIQLDVIYLNQTNTSGRQCEDGEIHGNTIDGIGRNGISFVHSKNIETYGNIIKNIHLLTTTLASGIDVEVNGTGQFRNENLKIYHNFIRNCDIGVQVLMAGGDDTTQNIKVFHNSIDYCGNGIQLLQLLSTNGSDIDVTQNYLYFCNNGITIDQCSLGKVLDNIIEKNSRTNNTNGFGIAIGTNRTNPNTNIDIKGNKISDTDSNGIYAQYISLSHISGNDIKNTSLSSAVTEKCSIRLLYTCNQVKLSRNIINDTSIPLALTELTGTITNIELSSNEIISTNGTIYWIVVASPTITKVNNRVNGVGQNEGTYYRVTPGSITVGAGAVYTYTSTIIFSDNNRTILVTKRSSTTDNLIIKPRINGGTVQIDFINPTGASITASQDFNMIVYNNN